MDDFKEKQGTGGNMVRSIFAALIGALVVFGWSYVSWMVLPWHNWDMKSFKQGGEVVAQAIKAEAPEAGIYVLPNIPQGIHDTPRNEKELEERLQKEKAWEQKAHQGPFAYLSVNPAGLKWDMKMALINQFLIQLITAFIAVWLLNRSALQAVFHRALFVSLAVSVGAFLCSASNWNWWGFPLTSSVVNFADPLIAWFVAGLFMAKIAK